MTAHQWHIGNSLTVLRTLPPRSVDLVLSSPPFLALRSYLPADDPGKAQEMGSEATPGAFIDALLDVVEACADVLAPHGSLCFELGDTYSGSGGAGGDYNTDGLRDGRAKFTGSAKAGRLATYADARGNPAGMRDTTFSGANTRTGGGQGWPDAKSLCLIPESFRWALVYGRNPFTGRETPRWRVRNVIRWCRPNPPVGALGDKFRPATSEMVVACKARDRYFDLDAVRQPSANDRHQPTNGAKNRGDDRGDGKGTEGPHFNERTTNPAGAPPLDWWNIPTQGYAGSHYATWPKTLLLRPIKAMCPERVCLTCGEPSRRITDVSYERSGGGTTGARRNLAEPDGRTNGTGMTYKPTMRRVTETAGWSDCGCRADGSGEDGWRHGVVLDPFGGSGTTADVCNGLGRDSVSIDLDPRNVALAQDRLGMFPLDVTDHRVPS